MSLPAFGLWGAVFSALGWFSFAYPRCMASGIDRIKSVVEGFADVSELTSLDSAISDTNVVGPGGWSWRAKLTWLFRLCNGLGVEGVLQWL